MRQNILILLLIICCLVSCTEQSDIQDKYYSLYFGKREYYRKQYNDYRIKYHKTDDYYYLCKSEIYNDSMDLIDRYYETSDSIHLTELLKMPSAPSSQRQVNDSIKDGKTWYEVVKMDTLYDITNKCENNHISSGCFCLVGGYYNSKNVFLKKVYVYRGNQTDGVIFNEYFYEDVVFKFIPDTCQPYIEDKVQYGYFQKETGMICKETKIKKHIKTNKKYDDLRESRGNNQMQVEWQDVEYQYEPSYITHFIYIPRSALYDEISIKKL